VKNKVDNIKAPLIDVIIELCKRDFEGAPLHMLERIEIISQVESLVERRKIAYNIPRDQKVSARDYNGFPEITEYSVGENKAIGDVYILERDDITIYYSFPTVDDKPKKYSVFLYHVVEKTQPMDKNKRNFTEILAALRVEFSLPDNGFNVKIGNAYITEWADFIDKRSMDSTEGVRLMKTTNNDIFKVHQIVNRGTTCQN